MAASKQRDQRATAGRVIRITVPRYKLGFLGVAQRGARVLHIVDGLSTPVAIILQELGRAFERARVWIGRGGIERRIDQRRHFTQLDFTVRTALGDFEFATGRGERVGWGRLT